MKSTIIILLSVLLISCNNEDCGCDTPPGKIIGEGPVVSKDYDLASFNSVSILSFTNIRIETGLEQSIKLSGQKNILDILIAESKNNKLDITFPAGNEVQPTEDLTAIITMPNALQSFSFIGIAEMELLGDAQENLTVNITGSGNINSLELPVNTVVINWTGEGMAKIHSIENLILNCVGVFDIKYKGDPSISNNSVGTINLGPID